MPGGRSGLFPGVERLHQSAEYKQREAEDELLRSVGSDRLLELSKAEKDGRLVVLPCKAGDLLYEVDLPEYGVITCKVLHVGTYNGPAAHVEGNHMVSAVSVGVEVVEGHGKGSGYAFEAEDFGKIVFLEREAAEAELKEREG